MTNLEPLTINAESDQPKPKLRKGDFTWNKETGDVFTEVRIGTWQHARFQKGDQSKLTSFTMGIGSATEVNELCEWLDDNAEDYHTLAQMLTLNESIVGYMLIVGVDGITRERMAEAGHTFRRYILNDDQIRHDARVGKVCETSFNTLKNIHNKFRDECAQDAIKGN